MRGSGGDEVVSAGDTSRESERERERGVMVATINRTVEIKARKKTNTELVHVLSKAEHDKIGD